MNILNRLYTWYGKRTVLTVFAVVLGLVIAGIIIASLNADPVVEAPGTSILPVVELSRVDAFGSQSLFKVIGEVKATSEARLQAEAGGRITNVNVELGDTVHAGQVIASFENSSQRAALLQAEGAYEAALASAASSEVSVESAQEAVDAARSSALSIYRSSYITAEGILRNDIDDLFTIVNDQAIGIRIDSKGQANVLNAERNALDTEIAQWQTQKDNVTVNSIDRELGDTKDLVNRMAAFVEQLSSLLSDTDITSSFTEADKTAMIGAIYSARTSLNGLSSGLEQAETAIVNAQNAFEQAQLTGSSDVSSAASAQIKIALGSLRAAQASYEKTIVRTPISGVVNALYLTPGEYASMGAPAVVIANNGALEVVTALNADEADMIAIGDTVHIDDIATGVVTAIAPAIDPLSGKKEVRIGIQDDVQLTNGDTVNIEFSRNTEKETDTITIPLSALKITTNDPVVFSVSEQNTLVSNTVKIGKVMGDVVEIIEGLSHDSVIVVDARGLRDGETVEVIAE